jgi:hypothetical protein
MLFKEILLLILAIAITLAVPLGIVACIVYEVRRGHKRERRGGGGGGGICGAMQEFDRLTRPSVEHVIEAQNQTLRREDDEGGE